MGTTEIAKNINDSIHLDRVGNKVLYTAVFFCDFGVAPIVKVVQLVGLNLHLKGCQWFHFQLVSILFDETKGEEHVTFLHNIPQ